MIAESQALRPASDDRARSAAGRNRNVHRLLQPHCGRMPCVFMRRGAAPTPVIYRAARIAAPARFA